jgi:hypothetical protein
MKTTIEQARIKYGAPTIGCYVDASACSADDCNLRTIRFAQNYGFDDGALPALDSEDYSQFLSDAGDDAVTYLNDIETRSFMYWTFEDNSLFLVADVEGAREDVEFVSSRKQDYPADDYRGEWLHVSDHGNATLYIRGEDGKDSEIWGVV